LRFEGAVAPERVHGWLDGAFERLERAPERYAKEWFDPKVRDALTAYRREEPESWMAGRVTIQGDTSLHIAEVAPTVWDAMVELVGGDPQRLASHQWPNGVIADHRLPGVADVPPPGPEPLVGPGAFHVDQPMPDAILQGYRLGFVTLVLLEDIAPGEGATVLVADSIGPIARALLDAPGSYDLTNNAAIASMWEAFNDRVEATGKAGDVYLSHSLVAHAAGPARLRRDSDAPWLRLLANPCTDLRGGLRFGKAALNPPAPIDRAVTHALGDRAAQMDDWSPVPAQRHPQGREPGRAEQRREPRHAPRRLALPKWLVEALAPVGAAVFASVQQEALTLTLRRRSETVFVRLVQPDKVPYRLPYATSAFGVAYQGRVSDGPGLCQQVGEALQSFSDEVRSFLADPAAAEWSEPDLEDLLQRAGDPSARASDTAKLEALLARSWNPADADALAVAALMLGQPEAISPLAAKTAHRGLLLPILDASLAGDTDRAVADLRELASDRRTEPTLAVALGRLAVVIGHDADGLDILEAAEGRLDGSEQGRAMLDILALRLQRGESPDGLRRPFEKAWAALEDDVSALLALARVASLLGERDVAEHTLMRASSHHSIPEAFAALAELRLARGDQAGAQEAATLGARSQDPELVERLSRVVSGEPPSPPSSKALWTAWARDQHGLVDQLTAMWMRAG